MALVVNLHRCDFIGAFKHDGASASSLEQLESIARLMHHDLVYGSPVSALEGQTHKFRFEMPKKLDQATKIIIIINIEVAI